MRDHLVLYVNGQRRRVSGAAGLMTLSTYLRETLGLPGTKIVCAEGDCGACAVVVGRPTPAPGSTGSGQLKYQSIDACIAFLYQLDRTHVVSVEGLADGDTLTPVQDAMVRCHGSQCGFCTPGFVTTMHGLLEEGADDGGSCTRLDEDTLRLGLSGNLCRCTGYRQILDAGLAIDPARVQTLNVKYDPSPMLDAFATFGDEPLQLTGELRGTPRTVYLPRTLEQAIHFRGQHPGCTIAAGTTDLGVQHNHGRVDPDVVLSMKNVAGFNEVRREDGALIVGAGATWTDVIEALGDELPDYRAVLLRFGSPQIRNVATVGGNLANASPIADSIPLHYVMEAELELVGVNGSRTVPVEQFYLGYKQLDLAADEMIASVRLPLPVHGSASGGERLKLYKVSKRRDMDISTFTAAVRLTLDVGTIGDPPTIAAARLAFGGVGPTVMRLPLTERFLTGRPLTEATMRDAGRQARAEITPISDVRAHADYRHQLADNILVKCYHDLSPQGVLT
jgi:xanthine dehydrogenase small subunit